MKPIFHKTDSVAEQFTLETLYKHRKAISIHSKSVQNEKADFQAPSILNTGWLPSFLFCQPIIILLDRKSTRLNSSHMSESRMPSSA